MRKTGNFLAVLSLALFAATAQANLLDDGSFDAATPGGQTSNSAWTLNANFPDPNNPGDSSAQFQDAPWASNDAAAPEHGVWFKSFTGKPGAPAAQADLSQSVAASAGGSYILNFDAKRELNFTAGEWKVTLSSDGTGGSDSIELLAAAPNDGSWNTYSLALSGVTSGDNLTVLAEMIDGTDFGTNPQSAMLDNFSLAIPEPGSFVLASVSLLGLLSRRRRG